MLPPATRVWTQQPNARRAPSGMKPVPPVSPAVSPTAQIAPRPSSARPATPAIPLFQRPTALRRQTTKLLAVMVSSGIVIQTARSAWEGVSTAQMRPLAWNVFRLV